MFPGGESIVALQEKTLEGRIVLDVFQTGVGPLREPIVFDLRRGRAEQIKGGIEAHLLRELLEKYGDENSYFFGEFALGTNPKARFIGSAGEDKKRIGTIHLSLGDDIDIGGELKSKLHLDGVMRRPTLVADGQTKARIVIGVDAPGTVRFAAKELQTFVAKMSGAELPIAAQAAPGVPVIRLGPAARQVLPPEALKGRV